MDRLVFTRLTALCMTLSAATLNAQTAPEKTTISIAELTENYNITGPLDASIGELLTIEGRCDNTWYKHGGEGNSLIVSKVNGKTLSKPIQISYTVFNWANVKQLQHGETYTVRGYQHAIFRGIPGPAMKETVPVQSPFPYGLHCYLMVINQLDPMPPPKHSAKYVPAIPPPTLTPPSKANEP